KQNNKHTFVINLAEIAHNDYIGTLTLSLTTINNDSTQNKDYLHLLDVDLKLLNNMITLKTDESNQLYLIDIGKVVDITNAETFFAFYDDVNHFGQDGEYEKEGNGAWKQANTGTSEIRLISNGITVQTISGNIASKVDLPNLANIINDDGIVKREFKFAGWYYNEDCTEKFETSVFPRYNTTLFAKWIEFDPKYHATINFVSGIENLSVEPILGYVGDELILPILANIDKTVDENTSVLKEFLGWFTLDNEKFVQNVIESNNLTLFAKWSEKITKTYCLQIYSAGEKVYDGKVEAGKEFVFPNAPYFNETTRYYTNSNFDESSIVTNFVVNENSIWHARNKHTYKIASEHTTQTGGTSFEEGLCYEKEIVTLKTYSNFKIDKGTYWIEYEFKGYYLNGGTELFSGEYVMPSTDVSFVACWEKQEYCQVQFDVNSWEYPSWWTIKSWRGNQTNVSSVSNTDGNKIVIKRGAELKFDDYVATCECKYKINYKFKTAGWAENVSNIYDKAYDIKSLIITSNQTLKPVWKHA
ncbi:MAG: InlB B-repeat-containing protein, partial [Christensenellales bacterium]